MKWKNKEETTSAVENTQPPPITNLLSELDSKTREALSKDRDGDEIWWGECWVCGERAHHKVKEVTHRVMQPGETYYFTHEKCRKHI